MSNRYSSAALYPQLHQLVLVRKLPTKESKQNATLILQPFGPLPSSYTSLPHDILSVADNIEFSVEEKAVADYERMCAEEAKADAARLERLARAAAEEAKRKAPGLGAAGEILRPVPAAPSSSDDGNSQPPSADSADQKESASPPPTGSPSNSSDQQSQPSTTPQPKQRIDYLEFEQGLPPPDPWDPKTNDLDRDLQALREVMGGQKYASQQQQPAQVVFGSQPSIPQMGPPATIAAGPSAEVGSMPPPYTPFVPTPSPVAINKLHQQQQHAPGPSFNPKNAQKMSDHFQRLRLNDSRQPSSSPTPPRVPPRPNLRSPIEEKTYTTCIQMGFQPDLILRGIRLYSTNKSVTESLDKLVLDFVIRTSELMAMSPTYTIDAVEMAVTAYPDASTPVSTVRQFLDAFVSIYELGFEPAKIRDAWMAKPNINDAIEILMGNS